MKKFNKPVIVRVTAKEQKHIARRAKAAGISTAEFMRRAAMSYIPIPPKKGAMLKRMTGLLNQSTARAGSAIDDAVAYVHASNIRIGEMENREKSEPYERTLVLEVSIPAGMDPAVAASLKPKIEQALELLMLAEQPAAIEHADRIAQLLLGKIEPNTGLAETRLANRKSVGDT